MYIYRCQTSGPGSPILFYQDPADLVPGYPEPVIARIHTRVDGERSGYTNLQTHGGFQNVFHALESLPWQPVTDIPPQINIPEHSSTAVWLRASMPNTFMEQLESVAGRREAPRGKRVAGLSPPRRRFWGIIRTAVLIFLVITLFKACGVI